MYRRTSASQFHGGNFFAAILRRFVLKQVDTAIKETDTIKKVAKKTAQLEQEVAPKVGKFLYSIMREVSEDVSNAVQGVAGKGGPTGSGPAKETAKEIKESATKISK
jgi:hypothetical protein